MKLTTDKLAELAHGAVRVIDNDGKTKFYRFTEAQQELYKNSGNESFYTKTFTSAGVRLVFKTDSKSMFLKICSLAGTTRTYFSVDVCVDGEMIGCINNYEECEMSGNYTCKELPLGSFEKSFDLGAGVKTVTVFFPWSVLMEIEELSIDDGAFAEPVLRDKKMLVFGDSITQGYDALHPSKHYASMLSDFLNADAYNKAIGGEIFIPALADTKEDFVPDYILVAYGTNDWSHCELDVFEKNCKEFYEILSRKYPSAKIFALTPIWRKNHYEEHNCGTFSSAADYIEAVAEKLDNVYCLRGFDFVPHQENMFGDLYLHPNDDGFAHYAKNLCEAVKDILD